MTAHLLPDPATGFGERVCQRLRDEQVIWFTTVGADGTPQPNPVWFLWEDNSALVYNRSDANRLTHIRRRPQVCLHFDGNGRGGDIVVLAGRAQVLEGPPSTRAARLPGQVQGEHDSCEREPGSIQPGIPRSGPCRCRPRPRILIAAPQNRSRCRDPRSVTDRSTDTRNHTHRGILRTFDTRLGTETGPVENMWVLCGKRQVGGDGRRAQT
jgi:PPOX class probable F420-dependent enzyme